MKTKTKILTLLITLAAAGCSSTQHLIKNSVYDITPKINQMDVGTIKAVQAKIIPTQVAEDPELYKRIVYYRRAEELAQVQKINERKQKGESFLGRMVREGVVTDLLMIKAGLGPSFGPNRQTQLKNFGELELGHRETYRGMHFLGEITPQCNVDCLHESLVRTLGYYSLELNKRYNKIDPNKEVVFELTDTFSLAVMAFYADDEVRRHPLFFNRKLSGKGEVKIDNKQYFYSDGAYKSGVFITRNLAYDEQKDKADRFALNAFIKHAKKNENFIFFLPVVYKEITEDKIECYGGYFMQGERATSVDMFGCDNPEIADAQPVIW